MRIEEFDNTVIEAWAAYEIFRDLGFGSEDIGFVHTSGDSHVMVTLYGDRFNYSAGYCKVPVAEFDAQWERFTTALQSGELADTELARAYNNSLVVQHVTELLAELERKGIKYNSPTLAASVNSRPN